MMQQTPVQQWDLDDLAAGGAAGDQSERNNNNNARAAAGNAGDGMTT